MCITLVSILDEFVHTLVAPNHLHQMALNVIWTLNGLHFIIVYARLMSIILDDTILHCISVQYYLLVCILVKADVILLAAPWDPRSATQYVKVL